MILLALVGGASAQSCSCSVAGGGAVGLPAGDVPRAGSGVVSVDYSALQTGGEDWTGFVAIDRGGNSMPSMAMPGHFVQTVRMDLAAGLPAGFSATAGAPWSYSHPLYPSDMPGDVDQGFFGDASVSGRWAIRRGALYGGVSAGATLPTGRVVEGYGVRGGRGAVGLTGDVQLAWHASPFVTVSTVVAGGAGAYESPIDALLVGPSINVVAGAAWTPREMGRLKLQAWATLLNQGHDVRAGVPLEETGLTAASLALGGSFRFWAHRERSASWMWRAQGPLWQSAGDPWLQQNWALGTGLSLVAF